MRCSDAMEKISLYIDGELNEAEAEALLAHLEGCKACKREYEEIKSLVDSLRDLDEIELPPGYHEELMKKIASANVVSFPSDKKEMKTHRWRKYSTAAAALILLLAVGSQFGNIKKANEQKDQMMNNARSMESAEQNSSDGTAFSLEEGMAPENLKTDGVSADESQTANKGKGENRISEEDEAELPKADGNVAAENGNMSSFAGDAKKKESVTEGSVQMEKAAAQAAAIPETASVENGEPVDSGEDAGQTGPMLRSAVPYAAEAEEIKEAKTWEVIIEKTDALEAIDKIEAVIVSNGGYFVTAAGNDSAVENTAELILEKSTGEFRVPSQQYETAKTEIMKNIVIVSQEEKNEDETDEYKNAESVITNETLNVKSLTNELSKAASSEEKERLENELNISRENIALNQNKLEEIDNSVAYASIQIQLK